VTFKNLATYSYDVTSHRLPTAGADAYFELSLRDRAMMHQKYIGCEAFEDGHGVRHAYLMLTQELIWFRRN
jgi:hypothetical protein